MTWNNELNLADIISIMALIGTFVTVVLILIQRHDSARPFITIRTKNNKSHSISFDSNEELKIDIDEDAVTISCFGNNMAKNIEVESYFLLDKEAVFYKNLRIVGGTGKVIKDGKMVLFFLLNPTRTKYGVINCNETINLTAELMGKLLGVGFCGFDAVSQFDERYIPVSASAIILKVTFFDLLGKKYCNYFIVSGMFSSFSKTSYSFRLNSEILSKRQFAKMLDIYKTQKCCGSFRNEYTPSYKREGN